MKGIKILGKVLGEKKEKREIFLPKVGIGDKKLGFPQQS